MLDDDDPPETSRPKKRADMLARLQEILAPKDGEQDNETLTKAAVVVALGGSVLLALVLLLGGGEAPVRAATIDDPHALRAVDVRWDPPEGRANATTGGGGMSGGGGYGGGLMNRLGLSRPPCTAEPPPLKDAVRRTAGINMISGKVGPTPCAK